MDVTLFYFGFLGPVFVFSAEVLGDIFGGYLWDATTIAPTINNIPYAVSLTLAAVYWMTVPFTAFLWVLKPRSVRPLRWLFRSLLVGLALAPPAFVFFVSAFPIPYYLLMVASAIPLYLCRASLSRVADKLSIRVMSTVWVLALGAITLALFAGDVRERHYGFLSYVDSIPLFSVWLTAVPWLALLLLWRRSRVDWLLAVAVLATCVGATVLWQVAS